MASVSTSIKIDPEPKRDAQELFESLESIPFRTDESVFNDETRKAIENARNGIGLSHGFTSVTELMEKLDADD